MPRRGPAVTGSIRSSNSFMPYGAPVIRLGWARSALLVLVAFCPGCSGRSGEEIRTATVQHGPFGVAVVEDGELRAVMQTTITAKVSGKIEWLVPEGSDVKEGDVLVELEKKDYEESLEKTQESLKEAETKLEDLVDTLESQKKELEDQVRVADVALKVARLKLKMLQESPTDREKGEARADLESANLERKQAELDLKRTTKLAAEGIVPDVEHRKALTKARIARAQTNAAQFLSLIHI